MIVSDVVLGVLGESGEEGEEIRDVGECAGWETHEDAACKGDFVSVVSVELALQEPPLHLALVQSLRLGLFGVISGPSPPLLHLPPLVDLPPTNLRRIETGKSVRVVYHFFVKNIVLVFTLDVFTVELDPEVLDSRAVLHLSVHDWLDTPMPESLEVGSVDDRTLKGFDEGAEKREDKDGVFVGEVGEGAIGFEGVELTDE